jgi:hypothetical protein
MDLRTYRKKSKFIKIEDYPAKLRGISTIPGVLPNSRRAVSPDRRRNFQRLEYQKKIRVDDILDKAQKFLNEQLGVLGREIGKGVIINLATSGIQTGIDSLRRKKNNNEDIIARSTNFLNEIGPLLLNVAAGVGSSLVPPELAIPGYGPMKLGKKIMGSASRKN